MDPAGEDGIAARAARRLRVATSTLVRSSHVWLLAPTWIAVNASIGLWFSQSIFQFARANPDFPDQALMRGFERRSRSRAAAVVIGIVFGLGLLYWGNRFKNLRRTTIILYGILGGAALVGAGLVVNHATGLRRSCPSGRRRSRRSGCSSWPGRHPAALGLLADISERFPHDRGAIMGLYSVFLAVGQIIGALIGGIAADLRGIDGMLIATMVLLVGRPVSHSLGCGAARTSWASSRRDRGPSAVDARSRSPAAGRRGRRAAPPRHAGRPGVLRPGGSAVDAAIATNAVLGVVMPRPLRARRRRVLAHLGRGRAGASTALNGSGRSAPRPTSPGAARPGPGDRSRGAGH